MGADYNQRNIYLIGENTTCMNRIESVLGSRSKSSPVIVVVGLKERGSVINYIKTRFDDEIINAIELFNLNATARGWLILTKSRVIFYINQDANNFEEIDHIKWVIDDLKNTSIHLHQTDQNEIEIIPGKSILFDSNLISGDRLIQECENALKSKDELKADAYNLAIVKISGLSNIITTNARLQGNLSDPDASALNIDLNQHLIKKFMGSGLSIQEFEKLIRCASRLAMQNVNQAHLSGYLNAYDQSKIYVEILSSHLDNLLASGSNKEESRIITETKPNKIAREQLKFISAGGLDNFYQTLIQEINETYTNSTYTSTLILCRKLVENLLIDLLRKKYGRKSKDDVEIYYNPHEGRFHEFTYLVKNLESRKSDFKIDLDLIEEFLRLVTPFRQGANSKAHSLIYFIKNKEDLSRYDIQRMVDLLIRLRSHD